MRIVQVYFLIIIAGLITSCGVSTKNTSEKKTRCNDDKRHQLNIESAKYLKLSYRQNVPVVTLISPFDDSEEKFAIVQKGCNLPVEIEDMFVVEVPLENIACVSSTHIGMLIALGAEQSLGSVSKKEYVYNQDIRERIDNLDILTFGDGSELSQEKLIEMNPDCMIINGFEETSGGIEQVKNRGIPLVKNYEWKERTPLARLEWIKLFGLLTGKEAEADSVYRTVKKKYQDLSKKVSHEKVSIFSGHSYEGVWYMPAGDSYMAELYEMANANYKYSNIEQSGSLSFSFEKVLNDFMEADIWFDPGVNSFDELLMKDRRYGHFKAFKEKKIFTPNKQMRSDGSNNFWEEGVVRPDLILNDLIQILSGSNKELYFYQKLK